MGFYIDVYQPAVWFLDAGERLLKNTNAVNQTNVLATPFRTIQFFSDICTDNILCWPF
jgi:hypothetical protein